MIKLKHLISLILLISTFSAFSQAVDIPITGKVIDAKTSNPLNGALIIVSSGFGQNAVATDTFTTNSDGGISSTISLDASAYGVAFTVSADGYTSKTSYAMLENNALNLDTIKLEAAKMDTTVVIGIIADSETNDAIEGANISISSMMGVSEELTAKTDAQGLFTITVIYNSGTFTNYSYSVKADNYSEKSANFSLDSDTIDLGTINLVAIKTETITITGVVTDQNSGEALDSASVIITAGDTSISLITNNSGQFSSDLEYDAASVDRISYTVDKFGYREENGNQNITGNTIDLDTITLRPSQLDTVTVTAQVYYTDTETKVADADLLLYVDGGFNIGDFDYNNSDIQTLTSDNNGLILGKLIYESSGGGSGQMSMLLFALTLEGSENTEGTSFIMSDTVDLGDLYIDEPGTPITFTNKLKTNDLKPDQIQIYTLNGRMIFEGKTFNISDIKKKGVVLNQQLLIVNKLKGKVLSISKRQLLK